MENVQNVTPHQPNPRRKRRSPFQKFMKSYFPLIAVVLVIILFIIFAVGSVKRSNEKREQERLESLAVEESLNAQQQAWEQEALLLIAEAEGYAASCDFEKAIEILDGFSGNLYDFDNLVIHRERYEEGESSLVAWEDITKIPCLSFGEILVDAEKAFVGDGADGNRYYGITTGEFTAILQELYDNNYMVVDLYDIFSTVETGEGTYKIVKQELLLPKGKKPVLLVHSQSEGYTNKLTLTSTGDFTTTVTDGGATGAYDFVPLLEEFIESNPGFSYKGARAVLSVTGYNGYFGNPVENTSDITALVSALKEKGYTIASNSYGNHPYGKLKLEDLETDIADWQTNAVPLLGETDIIAFARSSDIEDTKEPYYGKKYNALHTAGFHYYLGVCYNSNPWMSISDESIRIGRIMVIGNNLENSPGMFEDIFDADAVLDPNRT